MKLRLKEEKGAYSLNKLIPLGILLLTFVLLSQILFDGLFELQHPIDQLNLVENGINTYKKVWVVLMF